MSLHVYTAVPRATNIVIVSIEHCFTDHSGGGDVSVDLFQVELLTRDGQYSVKRTGMEVPSLGLYLLQSLVLTLQMTLCMLLSLEAAVWLMCQTSRN